MSYRGKEVQTVVPDENRTLKENTSPIIEDEFGIVAGLKPELLERIPNLTNDEWETIYNKVVHYLQVTKQEFPPRGWASLADAINDFFKKVAHGNMGINTAVNAHEKAVITAANNLRKELAENPASEPEYLTSSGSVSLYNLVNKKQLEEESAQMNHCVGQGDYYINKIIDGTIQIWSLRDEGGQLFINGTSILTIEFDPKNKIVKQMKKFRDELIRGNEPWFPDLLRIFKKLSLLNPPVTINQFRDTGKIDAGDLGFINNGALKIDEVTPTSHHLPQAITFDGELVTDEQLIEKETEEVFMGEVELKEGMRPEFIIQLCNIKGLTLITSGLSQEQKDQVTHIAGNVMDRGSQNCFRNLISVGGDADFSKSITRGSANTLGKLETIGGNANFHGSSIDSLERLRSIGGSAVFEEANIRDLSRLKTVGENAQFNKCSIENVDELESIGNHSNFDGARISSLKSLKYLGGFTSFSGSEITNMESLEKIDGNVIFNHSKITNLRKLVTISGSAYINSCVLTDLGALKTVGNNLNMINSKITNLENLEFVGNDFNIGCDTNANLSSLREIGRHAAFSFSMITSLASLEIIGGEADFENSKIENLEGLREIGGDANFINTPLRSLPKLETIGGNGFFADTNIENLESLREIGGSGSFIGSQVNDVRSLRKIGGAAGVKGSKVADQVIGQVEIGRHYY